VLTQNFFWPRPRERFTAIADLMQNFLKQKSQPASIRVRNCCAHDENFVGIGFAGDGA
jgi:hypothetical protein